MPQRKKTKETYSLAVANGQLGDYVNDICGSDNEVDHWDNDVNVDDDNFDVKCGRVFFLSLDFESPLPVSLSPIPLCSYLGNHKIC